MGNEDIIQCLKDIRKWSTLMRWALRRGDFQAFKEWQVFYEYDLERLKQIAQDRK